MFICLLFKEETAFSNRPCALTCNDALTLMIIKKKENKREQKRFDFRFDKKESFAKKKRSFISFFNMI